MMGGGNVFIQKPVHKSGFSLKVETGFKSALTVCICVISLFSGLDLSLRCCRF